MDLLRTLGMILLACACAPTMAHETSDPFESATYGTTLLPFMIVGGTTALTVWNTNMKSAKADALAFIGSGGEIRGAQFEQAVRYYHSAYSQPYMSDEQLALAIVTSI